MPFLSTLLLPTAGLFPRHRRLLPAAAAAADEPIIGDCLVFEGGAFDDPSLAPPGLPPPPPPPTKPRRKPLPPPRTEELVPAEWREAQAALNLSKKERRVIARKMRFASRVEAGRRGRRLLPEGVGYREYREYRDGKMALLRPVVLDEPEGWRGEVAEGFDGGGEEVGRLSSGRVEPRDPRVGVEKSSLEDIATFFNSARYEPPGVVEGPRKLFSKEEKELLNKRVPNYNEATSDKWIPLHTLAASGEFYLVDKLLKYNAQINSVDKNGLTALHKAIICKKQAITNYLLRESANPFVRDKEGATLLHYAVRTASIDTIKILLLYNVDINLADDDGWTPLHLAVQAKRTDIVRLLLIKGADKTKKNKDGLTPLDLCLYSGRDIRTYELIKLLKELPKICVIGKADGMGLD